VQLTRTLGVMTVTAAVALGGAACNRSKSQPPTDRQVSGDARNPDVPITVTGCLRAGEASDTYVITQDAQNTGAQDTANYQLVGANGVDLRQHVGQRVQVSGVLAAQQEVASRSAASAQKPTGTSGTPTVQTQTQVDIRTLQVSSVNPQGGKCEMK
jgi:hypothetical protein